MRVVSAFQKRILVAAALAGLAAGPVRADDFPPELFPGIAGKTEADLRLAGIAALSPGRILDHDPVAPKPAVPEMRKTLVAELPRGGEYLRLYTLDTEAVRTRAGRKPLIVDCRYLTTSPDDLEKCLEFGGKLGGLVRLWSAGDYPGWSVELPKEAGGGKVGADVFREYVNRAHVAAPAPVVVLVNGRTSGPIEAVLASLQQAKRIFIVGGNTAGVTGAYRRAGDRWILSGEVKPDGAVSLVGVGVTPKFPVKTTPEDEFYGWQIVERGAPLAAVSRHDGQGATSAVPSTTETAGVAKAASAPEATDAVLQRAQDVLSALAVLGSAGEGR